MINNWFSDLRVPACKHATCHANFPWPRGIEPPHFQYILSRPKPEEKWWQNGPIVFHPPMLGCLHHRRVCDVNVVFVSALWGFTSVISWCRYPGGCEGSVGIGRTIGGFTMYAFAYPRHRGIHNLGVGWYRHCGVEHIGVWTCSVSWHSQHPHLPVLGIVGWVGWHRRWEVSHVVSLVIPGLASLVWVQSYVKCLPASLNEGRGKVVVEWLVAERWSAEDQWWDHTLTCTVRVVPEIKPWSKRVSAWWVPKKALPPNLSEYRLGKKLIFSVQLSKFPCDFHASLFILLFINSWIWIVHWVYKPMLMPCCEL